MTGKFSAATAPKEVYDVTSLGAGLKKISERELDFNHEVAEGLLNLKEFKGDRSLRSGHVNNLITAMQRGTFHPEWVNIIVCRFEKENYRMNGQHTAWARLEMPKSWKCPVRFIQYEAKNEEDLRQLYSSIDRNAPRTRANVIDSYLAGTEEFNTIGKGLIRNLASGFTLWKWPNKHDRKVNDGDAVAYLLKTDYYDLTIKVGVFLGHYSKKNHGHVFRSAVIAAMYATFHKAPLVAEKFWKPVCDGTGFEHQGDPGNRLRTKLMQTAVDTGGGSRSGKEHKSTEYVYRMCIVAWNAYRQGRTVQYLKPTDRGRRPQVK